MAKTASVAKTVKAAKGLKLIVDAGALATESRNLIAAVGKMDKRIQLYLVSELSHIAAHRNPTRLNEFFAAMNGKGARVTAMSAYVQKFGNLKVDEVKNKFVMDDSKTFDLALAEATDWTSMKPENSKLVSFDLTAQVQKLIDRALAAATDEDRKAAGDKIDLEVVKRLSEVIGYVPEAIAPKADAPKLEVAATA